MPVSHPRDFAPWASGDLSMPDDLNLNLSFPLRQWEAGNALIKRGMFTLAAHTLKLE